MLEKYKKDLEECERLWSLYSCDCLSFEIGHLRILILLSLIFTFHSFFFNRDRTQDIFSLVELV
jgi:hypothetical protein